MEQELLTRLASLEAYVRLDAVEKLANTPWPEADSERADLANVTLFRFQDIEFDIRAEMLKAAEGWGPDAHQVALGDHTGEVLPLAGTALF